MPPDISGHTGAQAGAIYHGRLMHFDDQDVYIRRNLVALSTGIIVVSILEVPVGRIFQNLFSVDISTAIERVSMVVFGAFLYLSLRMKVSTEGRKFRQRFLRSQKAVSVLLFVSDLNRWGNRYIKGGREHRWAKGTFSRDLEHFWTKHNLQPSTQRVRQSWLEILPSYHNFPGTATVRIRFSSGAGGNRMAAPDGISAKFTIAEWHLRWLSWRSAFIVNFVHKVGMEVTVPMTLGLAAQFLVLHKLVAAYPPGLPPLFF